MIRLFSIFHIQKYKCAFACHFSVASLQLHCTWPSIRYVPYI